MCIGHSVVEVATWADFTFNYGNYKLDNCHKLEQSRDYKLIHLEFQVLVGDWCILWWRCECVHHCCRPFLQFPLLQSLCVPTCVRACVLMCAAVRQSSRPCANSHLILASIVELFVPMKRSDLITSRLLVVLVSIRLFTACLQACEQPACEVSSLISSVCVRVWCTCCYLDILY